VASSSPVPRGLPPDAPPGRRPRNITLATVTVVAVAALVIVALLVTGLLPGLGPSPDRNPGRALAYSAARSLADASAAGAAGGPWSLMSVNGVAATHDASGLFGVPDAYSYFEVIHYLTATRPEIPAFSGSLSSGLFPWWTFQYTNGTLALDNETVILVVVVVNDGAIALATEYGPDFTGVVPTLPTAGIVDSDAAMSTAVAVNASFIHSHPGLNASLTLSTPQPPSLGEVWSITLTTCAPWTQVFSSGTSSYTGSEYLIDVNSTTGHQSPTPAQAESPTCSSYG
jgi:hypothetical protein